MVGVWESKSVTHSVDVQDVDVRGRKERVLHKRSEHMPRFELAKFGQVLAHDSLNLQMHDTHVDDRRDEV
jgi:hypothetical protein